MSKDTPEILDIWKDEEGRRFTIIETTHKYIYVASRKLRGRGITIKTFTHAKIKNDWLYCEKYNKYLEEVIKVYERKDKQATETSIAYNELLEEYQKLKESRAELNSDIVDKAYENAQLKSEYKAECKRADELEDSYWKSEKENKKLKELLKECELWFTGIVGNMNDKDFGEHNKSLPIGNFEHIFKEFSQKIDEVLK